MLEASSRAPKIPSATPLHKSRPKEKEQKLQKYTFLLSSFAAFNLVKMINFNISLGSLAPLPARSADADKFFRFIAL